MCNCSHAVKLRVCENKDRRGVCAGLRGVLWVMWVMQTGKDGSFVGAGGGGEGRG